MPDSHSFASVSPRAHPTVATTPAPLVSLDKRLSRGGSTFSRPSVDSARQSLISIASSATTAINGDVPVRKPSKRERFRNFTHRLKLAPKRAFSGTEGLKSRESQINTVTEERHVAPQSPSLASEEINVISDQPLFKATEEMEAERHEGDGLLELGGSLAKNALQTVLHPLHHPKKKITGQLTVSEHPYLAEDADTELLEAHDEVVEAEAVLSKADPEQRQIIDGKKAKLDKVLRERDAQHSAWTLSKHVMRARAVPLKLVEFPHRNDFNQRDRYGNVIRWEWERYLGHLLIYTCQDFSAQYIDDSNDLPFNREELIRTLQRFLIASAPWQTWLMNVRKIYLWEDWKQTTKWLLIYIAILKTGYIMTFVFLYIVYITLRHRYMNDDIKFMKESRDRAADQNQTSTKLSELANRHGGEDWLDPLLDELGPLLQQQLGDLVDMLEILFNFYTWRNPRATIYALVFWVTCAVLAAATSEEFGARVLFAGAGLFFFILRPLQSHYPKYRHALSMPRWAHWNIPTNAELAMSQLRTQAQSARADIILKRVEEQESTVHALPEALSVPKANGLHTAVVLVDGDATPRGGQLSRTSTISSLTDDEDDVVYTLEETDLMSFHGIYEEHPGHLVITTTSVRFVQDPPSARKRHRLNPFARSGDNHGSAETSIGSNELWNRPFSSLVEIRKTQVPGSKILKHSKALMTDALVLEWLDGTSHKIGAMTQQDAAFGAIIGFSGIKFQVLHPVVTESNGEGGGFLQKHNPFEGGHGQSKKGGVIEELAKLT